MIHEWAEKVKEWIRERRSDLFTAAVIFLVGLGSFGLGRLSAMVSEKPPLTISDPESPRATPRSQASGDAGAAAVAAAGVGRYVGSKSGAAYHFPWCPGALRIRDANKIWFQTREEAEKKGYKPAANCPGL